MKNRKGFTLVELLAMLVVLGILMAVTIPNMTGLMKNQKLNSFKTDATNLAERAKTKVSKELLMGQPALGECFVLTLDYLDDNDDYKTGPNGGTYSQYDSFVIYTRVNGTGTTTKFKYYVRLVEETDKGNYGFDLVESEKIDNLKNSDIKEITKYGLTKEKTSSVATLNTTSVKNDIKTKVTCSNIANNKYFVHVHTEG